MESPRGDPLLPSMAHQRNIASSERLASATILFNKLPKSGRGSVIATDMHTKSCSRFTKHHKHPCWSELSQILVRRVEAGGCSSRGMLAM